MGVFDPRLDIMFLADSMKFAYGEGVFGPEPELRRLDSIRGSLLDSNASGPDPVYSIAMDVGREADRAEMKKRSLLFGSVAYAPGRIGEEAVRSQGHVHAADPRTGWSTPELVEVWQGKALVYLQEFVAEDPGRCLAIEASAGEQVVIPPGWGHYIANADARHHLVFGAWCTRQYGFVYEKVRALHGLAWFALLRDSGEIAWARNPAYDGAASLVTRGCRAYPELGLRTAVPIYQQFVDDPGSVQWVSKPEGYAELWRDFDI